MTVTAGPDTAGRALARLDEVEPRIKAFVEVYRDAAEPRPVTGSGSGSGTSVAGPLSGVPFAAKDLYDIGGRPTLSGSEAADGDPATEDAEAVRRLRAAGAVLIGKTTTHEYAFGTMSPPTRNPWDLGRVPGGSSGGSGAAVAAGVVPLALGTDTGGSIRIPAAVCGTVGFKPSYGLVSRSGVSPLSHTLDHAGPLAARVSLAAAAVDVLAGHDPRDPGSITMPPPAAAQALERGVQGLRLGVAEDFFFEHADADIAAACLTAVRELEAAGATLLPCALPGAALCAEIVLTIAAAEAAQVHRERLAARRERFQPDVVAALDHGLALSAVELLDAYAARRAVQEGAERMFSGIDALLSPTVGTAPPPLGATSMTLHGREVDTLTGLNALTVHADVIGAPALAIPAGFSGAGLPVSLQIMTAPGHDALALAIGQAYESRTEWHLARPPL